MPATLRWPTQSLGPSGTPEPAFTDRARYRAWPFDRRTRLGADVSDSSAVIPVDTIVQTGFFAAIGAAMASTAWP
jgi:hypothetical protein